jgi:predicted SAM-dependent methyltransferase
MFIHDIRKPLPFPDGSASSIYTSHVFEDLCFEEGKRLMHNAFRAPKGCCLTSVLTGV